MVNIKLKYNFVETPRQFIIAKPSKRKLLRIQSFAMINLRGVCNNEYLLMNYPRFQTIDNI